MNDLQTVDALLEERRSRDPEKLDEVSVHASEGYVVGPERPMEQDALVEDSAMEQALEDAQALFGTDYMSVFDKIGWEEYDWEQNGILGTTFFEPAEALNPWERPEDGPLSMDIDRRLYNSQFVPEGTLEHVIGHEGVHGEWFRGIYGQENRELGMPIPTLMASHAGLKQGDEAMEAVTEYTARMRNPEYEGQITPYQQEVTAFQSLLEDLGASMSEETADVYEGPQRSEELDLKYVDADIDYYIEHGEAAGEEYVLLMGDSEEVEEYNEMMRKQYEKSGDLEVFEYDSPLDEQELEYDMPEMEEYEEFMEENLEEYDRYSEKSDGGNDSYREMAPDKPSPEPALSPEADPLDPATV